jgi:hypothetical protein
MATPRTPQPGEDRQIDQALEGFTDSDLELGQLELPAAPSAPSPTLAAIPASRRPHPGTVCETCPQSMWMASDKDVKAYCRVMFVVVWSTKEPNVLTHCDGPFIDQEEDK